MSKIFRHYKNKDYKWIGMALHTETMERLVVYKTLYKNPAGELWVRPESMFNGSIELETQRVARFAPVLFEVQRTAGFSVEDEVGVMSLLLSTFPHFDKVKMKKTLESVVNVQLWKAYDKDLLVGFKLGYEADQNTFYSWLGAVAPEARERGIGGLLLSQQHLWCREHGYKVVQTKTKNQWREMLLLNIKSGFEIIGTELEPDQSVKIILACRL